MQSVAVEFQKIANGERANNEFEAFLADTLTKKEYDDIRNVLGISPRRWGNIRINPELMGSDELLYISKLTRTAPIDLFSNFNAGAMLSIDEIVAVSKLFHEAQAFMEHR